MTGTRCPRRRRWWTGTAWILVLLCACQPRVAPPPPGPVSPPPSILAAPSAPAAPGTIADQFITTFWCGPPLQSFDDARAAEIAAAGFNLVGASCEGAVNPLLTTRALRIAQRHGLRLVIKDSRLSAFRPLLDGWQERADRAIATYREHESLAAFFLLDEPSNSSIYPDIAALRRRIERAAPGVIGYVNLLPDYVFPGPEDYREYVESYLFRTRPRLLSYDHYPFLNGGDRPSFFDNLLLIRELAREFEVPFMLIVQLMPHADYRDVTWPELAWQVFHAVALGARGISYFAYWTPTQVPDNIAYKFRKGVIEGGLQTEHYRHVARLNPMIRAIADEIDGFVSAALWDSLGQFGESTPPALLDQIEVGSVTAGSFVHPDGRTATLVVNRDYRDPARITLRSGAAPPRIFDPSTRTWSDAPDRVEIPPGEGRLLRLPEDG